MKISSLPPGGGSSPIPDHGFHHRIDLVDIPWIPNDDPIGLLPWSR
jgi:hypothetical protein